jgi:trigger factor
MQVTREDLNPCTIKLSFTCDAEEVTRGFETAFRHMSKNVKLPGFRPGKAPRSMIEPLISQDEWNEYAAEEIINRAYGLALEEQGLLVDKTTAPYIVVENISREESKAEFTAKVPLPPKVEIGDYKNLPVEQPSSDVTDEEVEFEIEGLRKRGGTRETITDRGVEEGDVAVLNIRPEGDTGAGRNFMTIAGKLFPELDKAIKGMRVEEMKTCELTFPEKFQEKDWAKKKMTVQVTINSLSAMRLPELDDSFAQSLKTNNVDDLKNKLRENLGRAKQQMVRQIAFERLLTELMARSEISVSDNMWENLADRRLREYSQEQAAQGKTLDDYAQEQGMTVDQLHEAWREKAKLEVERALVIQEIYRREGMEITENDLRDELVLMCQEFNVQPNELMEELQKNNAIDELHFRALSRKVGDFLLMNATVTIAKA